MNPVDDFVDRLAAARPEGHVRNPYAGNTAEAIVCRSNFTRYLRLMERWRPATLLVGEAPGYRGCGRTGIPFTSEAIVLAHSCFGAVNGFCHPTEGNEPRREATATIVWRALDDLDLRPLLWNVFPFHPHRPGKFESNRTPTAAEVRSGERYLRELLALFPITWVVAVGNKASQALASWGIEAVAVRHPAHGGRDRFREGLQAWQEMARPLPVKESLFA